MKAWLLFIILNLHVCRKMPFFGLAFYEFLCMCGLLQPQAGMGCGHNSSVTPKEFPGAGPDS